jgi:predicted PurR-regulated permease PerM
MPEAIAILLIVLVSTLILGLTWLQTRTTPRQRDQEIERLKQHIAWLEERQRHAEQGNWDEDMRRRITAQLDEARQQLVGWLDAAGARP